MKSYGRRRGGKSRGFRGKSRRSGRRSGHRGGRKRLRTYRMSRGGIRL